MCEIEVMLDKAVLSLQDQLKKTCKRFMDRTDIKKAMTTVQQQLKNVFEIIISRYEDEEATDAMGAKKPLGGWSCISC